MLTVPASFDDMARTLTVEAARKAGLENLTLLEEPQAAFYCWLATHPPKEAAQLKPGDRCLVVDVGGGTSDFSLIQAVEQQGELGLRPPGGRRSPAAGRRQHGPGPGQVRRTKLPAAGRLDAAQYGMLDPGLPAGQGKPARSRSAGVLFGDGHGPRPAGHRRLAHAALTPADVRQVILDGFFPVVPRDAEPQRGARVGLHEMGLPYVSDPAITRHLALPETARHAHVPPVAEEERAGRPHAILFNGGVFQPASPARAAWSRCCGTGSTGRGSPDDRWS